MAIPKLQEKYTYDDYLTWPTNERWELIHGVPFSMSPAPSAFHQAISMELSRQISNFLKGKSCRVFAASFDVRFPGPEVTDTVVQPDISVICDISKIDKKGCTGPPDIIMEILSPHTASKDLKEKFSLYEQTGVKEYWILEPADKVIFIFNRGNDGCYGKPRIFAPPDKAESLVVTGLEISLEDVFTDLM